MKYKCSVCSELFKDLKPLLLHRKAHSNVTPKHVNKQYIPTVLICDVCYQTYKSKAGLERHLKSHYLPVRCRHCKLLVNACELEEHEKQHETKVLSCDQCDFSAHHQAEMLQHLSAQHPKSNSYICQLCDAEFVKKNDLERHVKIEHSSSLFICKDCGEMFDDVNKFQIHCENHSSVDPLQLPATTSKFDKEKNEDSSKIQEVAQPEIEERNSTHDLIGSGVRGDDQPPVVASSSRNHDKNSRKIFDGVSNQDQIKHRCGICGSTFKSLIVFKVHKSIHENVKSFVCDTCGEEFVQEDGLRQHVLTHATTKRVLRKKMQLKGRNYKCEACKMAYTSKNSLERHLTICSKGLKKQYVCKVCGMKFPKSNILYDHMKVHQKKKKLGCDTCGENFLEEEGLRQHMLTHTGHKCSKCGEVLKTKYQLNRHMKDKCECVLSELADKKKDLERQLVTYLKGDKPHSCKVCGKGFYREQTRDDHMKEHEQPNSLVCGTCGEEFLQAHLLHHHTINTHTNHICSKCGEAFSGLVQLKLHMDSNHEKKYKCDPCAVSYKYKKDWERHLASCPKTDNTYVCEVCGKTFRALKFLNLHRQRHDGARNYVCEECGKGFLSRQYLKRHLLVHSGRKPYKCSVCDKGFNSSSHLKRHQMWHTGQKPYKCEICHKQCIQKINLKRHVCKPLV